VIFFAVVRLYLGQTEHWPQALNKRTEVNVVSGKQGRVKFFNYSKGFGFVQKDGTDYFVHVSDITDGDLLIEDEEVSFRAVEGRKGWQAIEVQRLNPPSLDEEEGEVKFFNDEKGYGFIERDGKADAFAHYSDLDDPNYELLSKGMVVAFQVRAGRDGRARAYKIRVVSDPVEG